LFTAGLAGAQTLPQWRLDWRRIGNTVIDASLASPAGGQVDRVWYSGDGTVLYVLTSSGKVFETNDFEGWTPTTALPPASEIPRRQIFRLPEAGARLIPAGTQVYALGRAVYTTSDSGLSWTNLTEFRGQSILGDGLLDLVVSPRDPEEIAVAGRFGVWRSLDGGLSWTGGNDGLPNLPLRRILRTPSAGVSARAALDGAGPLYEVEWTAGGKTGWTPAASDLTAQELFSRQAIGSVLGAPITATAREGDFLYAGGSDGRLWVSPDNGRFWRPFRASESSPVSAIRLIRGEPAIALASAGSRLLRTMNGGLFWDDITANLPQGGVHAAAADLATGTIYAATEAGLFYTRANIRSASAPTPWTPISGLPGGPVYDVQLDEQGNQLFALVQGYGLFGAMAPHRFLDPRLVNAADYSTRPAAPGGLLSVLGSRVSSARAGSLDLPVLAATDAESQIQVPFEAAGSSLSLALTTASAEGLLRRDLSIALRSTSPAIFVDRDGSPMVLDADLGVMLDPAVPARAGGRLQILATGLGRVTPDWPTGLAAPLENAPKVLEPVSVFLDRAPVQVTRATLAPGYVGFYLIEVQLPGVVNNGPAELYIESGGRQSGRVSIHLAQ
jgi:uncharacterized protein (TIGR03437 family)